MKVRHKTHKNPLKLKLTRFRILSLGLIFLMAIFTGSVMTATKIQAMRIDQRTSKQETALHQFFSKLRKSKSVSITSSSSGGVTQSATTSPATQPTPQAPVDPAVPVAVEPTTTPLPTPVSSPAPRPAPSPKPAAPAPSPPPAQPSSGVTSTSLTYINNLRSSLGKPALTQNATMDQWALAHAKVLASKCTLFHQSIGDFLNKNIGPITVRSIAENVGYNTTIAKVLDGLKNSPGHYANMTGDFQYVGLGVVTATSGSCAGYVYTTQMFAK